MRFLFALGSLTALFSGSVTHAADKPNVIVILADDLGYQDVGVNGCRDVPTPHIDSIAKSGVRCTDGHSNHSFCAPTRAAFLTGRYQHRFGFEYNSGPAASTPENYGLPKTEQTLAERLKGMGYRTGMVGKWHLGIKDGLQPHQRGFDEHYGFLGGSRAYIPSPNADQMIRNGQPVEEPEYTTDAFADEAVRFIKNQDQRPYFLYLAFNAIHGPMQALDRYKARFPNITDPTRKTCAGMLSALDDGVGKVLAAVREQKAESNTLIVFFADNGGPTGVNTSSNAPYRGVKGQVLEGGHRVAFLLQWKGTLPAGAVYDKPVAGFDVHATAIAAAGGKPLADRPMDGVDLVPYLTGTNTGVPHETLAWRQGGGDSWAFRKGDWKLLKMPGSELVELYNLKDDVGESKNLADKELDRAKAMQAAYNEWSSQMQKPAWEQTERPRNRARRAAATN
jgi:arylsulfatase A-like enzyme